MRINYIRVSGLGFVGVSCAGSQRYIWQQEPAVHQRTELSHTGLPAPKRILRNTLQRRSGQHEDLQCGDVQFDFEGEKGLVIFNTIEKHLI